MLIEELYQNINIVKFLYLKDKLIYHKKIL